jgi:Rrf2 family nitric oxide-sensitive transcriptional repressor
MFIQISPMFSQTVEYALRAVVCLAQHAESPLTTQQIADGTQVPPDYLAKVMQCLGRGGIVQAQRGKHGGFTLSRPTNELTILEVVNTVDPVRRITVCPLRLKAHGRQLCPLHRRLDDALALIEEALGETFIADLLGETAGVQPLCNIARPAHA